jgi:hypothetical protein
MVRIGGVPVGTGGRGIGDVEAGVVMDFAAGTDDTVLVDRADTGSPGRMHRRRPSADIDFAAGEAGHFHHRVVDATIDEAALRVEVACASWLPETRNTQRGRLTAWNEAAIEF